MIVGQLAKFFLSSLIWGIAAASIKLPPLLGYIFSGILLGPSIDKYITADTIHYVGLIGEFGLLMLMFMAGLKLDIDDFIGKNNSWTRPIITTIFQILSGTLLTLLAWVLPTWFYQNYIWLAILALFAIISFILLQNISERIIDQYNMAGGYLITGFLLASIMAIIGGIRFGFLQTNSIFNMQTMFMTICIVSLNSTAVALKLLESRDKEKTVVGNSVTGILIAQDLAIVIMLIILEGLSTNSISIINLGSKVFIAFFLIYLVKLLSEHSPWWISDFLDYTIKISKELTALFAISICFAFAAIAHYIGFSDIYGAFIAGLMLGNLYKHDKYIKSICEPISNILMTMFFMWLGILFNLNEILQNWIPISLITLVVLAFKYFSNFTIIKTVYEGTPGLTDGCIRLSSILLTQMSEFSIVIVGLVAKSLTKTDVAGLYACDLTKACVITSLSIGSVVTVLVKNWMYAEKYIE